MVIEYNQRIPLRKTQGMKTYISDSEEIIQFNNKDTYVERHLVTSQGSSLVKREFKAVLTDELNKFLKKGVGSSDASSIRCLCIEVEKDDGMTWLAEKTGRIIHESFAQYAQNTFLLQGTSASGLPEISKLMPEKIFYGILGKSLKIKSSQKRITPKLVITSIAVPLILNILVGLISSPDFDPEKILSIFGKTYFWPSFFGILLLQLVHQHYSSGNDAVTIGDRENNLSSKLDEAISNKSPELASIKQQVVNAISPKQFRVIIIDNYPALDYFSKQIIQDYMTNNKPHHASELWIILENEKRGGFDSFKHLILSHPKSRVLKDRTTVVKLANISQEQKSKLVKSLSLPAASFNYTLIKTICKGNIVHSNWNIEQLEKHRKENPKDPEIYQEFELFYLLSMVSSPVRMHNNKDIYINMLKNNMEKGKLRRIVIDKILYKNGLSREELGARLDKIFPNPDTSKPYNEFLFGMVNLEETTKHPKFSIKPEIKYSMINNYRRLELPKPELCNLFWSLYWGEEIHKRYEVSWFRQLNDHLKHKGELSVFDDDTIKKINERLFDIYLQSMDGCFKTGLFNELPALVNDLGELCKEDIFKGTNRINQLALRTWRSYDVLKKVEILEKLLEVFASHGLVPTGVPSVDVVKIENHKHWELIPSDILKRTGYIALETLTKPAGKVVAVNELPFTANLLKINQYWIKYILSALAVKYYFFEKDTASIYQFLDNQSVRSDFEELAQMLRQNLDNLQPNDADLEIRLLCIADLIWNLGLVAAFDPPAPPRLSEDTGTEALDDRKAFAPELLDMIGDLAARMENLLDRLENNKKVYEDSYYFVKSITFSIYANSMMALGGALHAITQKHGSAVGLVGEDRLEKFNDIVSRFNGFLEFDIPHMVHLDAFGDTNAFNTRLDELNKLCIITWHGLDLNVLADAHNLKHLHYFILIGKYNNYDRTAKALGDLLRHDNLNGVIANLLLTLSEKEAIELQSYAYLKALQILQNNHFGDRLLSESFLLLFECFSDEDGLLDLNAMLQISVSTGVFPTYVNNLSDKKVQQALIEFLNIYEKITNKQLVQSLESLWKNRIASIKDGTTRSINDSTWDAFFIIQQCEKDPAFDITKALEDWKYSKFSSSYCWLINNAIGLGHFDLIKNDTVNSLEYNQKNFTHTSYLFLSLKLCREYWSKLSQQEKSSALLYLNKSIFVWSTKLNSENNISVYKTLLQCSQDQYLREQYKLELQKWHDHQSVVNEQKLRYMVKNRRYFDVFWFFYKALDDFGLEANLDYKDLKNSMEASEANIKHSLSQWTNADMPDPFFDATRLSSDFLLLGYYLFQTSLIKDPNFDEMRTQLNRIAEINQKYLFNIIGELDSIPPSFKEIINNLTLSDVIYVDPEEAG